MAEYEGDHSKPSIGARIAWGIWQAWFVIWRWLLAMLYAPFWAYDIERRAQQTRTLFAMQDAAQAAAARHLRDTLMRIEDAVADRQFIETPDVAAVASADAALYSFLRHLAEVESAS